MTGLASDDSGDRDHRLSVEGALSKSCEAAMRMIEGLLMSGIGIVCTSHYVETYLQTGVNTYKHEVRSKPMGR